MQVVRERCCGLDVHKKSVVACVLTPESQETRTFGTMTRQLVKLSEWLREHEVTHVAMESTGVYWKPIFNLMEDEFTVWVVNARHIKMVPGRKTDVKDAEWIAELLKHGLLKPSFIPERPQRELRELVRYRKSLVQERSREANRIQKVLEGANIKLGSVATDVLGASGRKMLRALADGEDDPKVLADMAKGRLREKLEALEEALLGVVGSHQRFMLATQLRRLSTLDADVERLDAEVAPTGSPAQGCAAGDRYDPRRGPSHCRDDRGRDGHRHGQGLPPRDTSLLGPGSVLATTAVPTSPSEARSRRATPPFSRLWWKQPGPPPEPRPTWEPNTTASHAASAPTGPPWPLPTPLLSCSTPSSRTRCLSWTWDTNTLRCATRPAVTRRAVRQLERLGHKVILQAA